MSGRHLLRNKQFLTPLLNPVPKGTPFSTQEDTVLDASSSPAFTSLPNNTEEEKPADNDTSSSPFQKDKEHDVKANSETEVKQTLETLEKPSEDIAEKPSIINSESNFESNSETSANEINEPLDKPKSEPQKFRFEHVQ